MIIGLLGFEFVSPNKGCEALGYSFIDIVSNIVHGDVEIYVFTSDSLGLVPQKYPRIKFTRIPLKIKDISAKIPRAMIKCDYIFDVTLGDSFSDIYSKEQCIRNMRFKVIAELFGKKYILLPQTYGPFEDSRVLRQARKIIEKADVVYCRDGKSQDYLKEICSGKATRLTTDLAFTLPYRKDMFDIPKDKDNIGLNVSGLLWKGGFTDSNQFNMSLDYQRFIRSVIEFFTASANITLHLIPHVVDPEENSYDDDYKNCELLGNEYGLVVAPAFKTPIEAKSYISNMDFFIGSRMHSTIASFSCGVPTVPVSYSRKFEGLFDSLGYEYVIHGNSCNEKDAIDMTIKFFTQRAILKKRVEFCNIQIDTLTNKFKASLKTILDE